MEKDRSLAEFSHWVSEENMVFAKMSISQQPNNAIRKLDESLYLMEEKYGNLQETSQYKKWANYWNYSLLFCF